MEETNEMSSEVTEEQELTQEALDAAAIEEEEKASPAEVEPTVPLHAHTALRERAQKAEIEAAELRGKMSVLENQNVKTATVSPLQQAKADYLEEYGDLEGFNISVDLYEKQEAYKEHQAALAQENAATQALELSAARSMKVAELVHDDFNAVVEAGKASLTPGEILDLKAAGEGFGGMLYEKCKAVIERDKPVTKETHAAPNEELSKLEAEKKTAAKKLEESSQEELLKYEIANPTVAAAFDL